MSVEGINHVNLAVPNPLLREVRDFYVNVVGLEEGERPNMTMTGHWLYGGDRALVHLMEPRGETPQTGNGTGAIDHVALTCTDLPAMIQRLEQADVSYRKREAPDQNLVQLFVQDPAGVKVELNFQS